jgi:hypothetical protein
MHIDSFFSFGSCNAAIVRTPQKIVFLTIAAIFLTTFGPFNSIFASQHVLWNFLTLLLAFALIMLLDNHGANKGFDLLVRPVHVTAKGLAIAFVFTAAVHSLALKYAVPWQPINAAGLTPGGWLGSHFNFTLFYLFFPALLLLNLKLVRVIELPIIARALSIALLLSGVIQIYQGYMDDTFFNNWQIGTKRVGGLATDPNSFALTTLAAVPIIMVGALFEIKRWRLFHVFVSLFVLSGLFLAGNRTAFGAWALLVLVTPIAFAIAFKNHKTSLRLAAFVAPALLMAIAVYLFTYQPGLIKATGVLGERLLFSWERFLSGGLHKLFFDSEVRGSFLVLGLALLARAPLAGWGPGGFYREYANEYYRSTGEIQAAFDSVLNHYLMIAIDFGLPILVLYSFLMLLPIIVGFIALSKLTNPRERFATLIILLSQAVFLLAIITIPPAYFPDLIWVWTLSMAILVTIGIKTGVVIGPSKTTRRHFLVLKTLVVLVVLISLTATYTVTFGEKGYAARLNDNSLPFSNQRNCYGIETHANNRWQWCGKDARVRIPVSGEQTEIVLTLVAANPDLVTRPLEVRYGLPNKTQNQVVLTAQQPFAQIKIPFEKAEVKNIRKDSLTEKYVVLSIDVSHTWVPSEMGVSADARVLGVSVQLPNSAQ